MQDEEVPAWAQQMEVRITHLVERRLEASPVARALRQLRMERDEAYIASSVASELQAARAETEILIKVAASLRQDILQLEARYQELKSQGDTSSSHIWRKILLQ